VEANSAHLFAPLSGQDYRSATTIITYAQLMQEKNPISIGDGVWSKWNSFKVEVSDARSAMSRSRKGYREVDNERRCSLLPKGYWFVLNVSYSAPYLYARISLGGSQTAKFVPKKDIDDDKEVPVAAAARFRYNLRYEWALLRGTTFVQMQCEGSRLSPPEGWKVETQVPGESVSLQIRYQLLVIAGRENGECPVGPREDQWGNYYYYQPDNAQTLESKEWENYASLSVARQ
jgi:hypothetical protein